MELTGKEAERERRATQDNAWSGKVNTIVVLESERCLDFIPKDPALGITDCETRLPDFCRRATA